MLYGSHLTPAGSWPLTHQGIVPAPDQVYDAILTCGDAGLGHSAPQSGVIDEILHSCTSMII